MMKQAIWAVALVLAAAVGTTIGVVSGVADVTFAVKQSPVVKLSNGCSGFYIGKGRFITAGHCIDSTAIEIGRDDGEKAPIKRALASPPGMVGGMDFAVLWVDDDKFTAPLEAATLQCTGILAVGSDVKVVGYPAGIGKLTTWGKIAAEPFITTRPGVPWKRPAYWLDITATGGSSGSIIAFPSDGDWRAIAILVGGFPGTSITVAVPIREVCEALDILE